MLLNLPEKYLSSLLPAKVVALDERGLLQAFVSGYQDRLEDLRSYVKKFLSLLDPAGLGNEDVVLASVRSEQGLTFLRSLDVDASTPDSQVDLVKWVSDTLAVEPGDVVSVTRGRDLLRESGAPTLYLLAATVGAALHHRIGTQDSDTQALFVKFLQTYFDRLKIKGTVKSFEALGHLIGFDEVSVQPLWGRLSPRIANDIGDARNNPDFSPMPEFDVRQALGLFYNPHEFRDGPFFEWSGTASPYLSDSRFYSQVVNGFNPWVRVMAVNQTDVLVDSAGTMVKHPVDGAYALAGGSPHNKASVTIAGTPLRFEALAEGESFNGLEVHIQTLSDTGTSADRLVRVYDRLSAVKYRTSYYDLGLAVTDESSAALFGNPLMRRNATLAANPGSATSPFRPWAGGIANYSGSAFDYTVKGVAGRPGTGAAQREQAARGDGQLDSDALLAAASQSSQVFDEVRPATRYPRTTSAGYVNNDEVALARYRQVEPLFVVSLSSGSSGGSATHAPGGSHTGRAVLFAPGSVTPVPLNGELTGSDVVSYTGLGISGTHNLVTNTWRFITVPSTAVPGTVVALVWEPVDTELIRGEPAADEAAWSASYAGGQVPVLSHDYRDFANWEVPAGYQVDLIGNSGFQVLDDVFSGQGVYANLSGVTEFGKLVSRSAFTWTKDSTYTFTVKLAGNHRLPVDSVLEIRFAGTTTAITRAMGDAFSPATVVSHIASADSTGTLEMELVSGVPGSGTLYSSGTLTGPRGVVLLSDDLNRSLVQTLSATVDKANAGQLRAEDEEGDVFVESTDDVPWRRDLTLGGELVDVEVYSPVGDDLVRTDVLQEVSVRDQGGTEFRIYSVDSVAQPPRMVQVPVPVAEGYAPGQLAIGYRGTLRSLSANDFPASFWETGVVDERALGSDVAVKLTRSLGGLFVDNDVRLYHVGLVNGVLVADAPSFNGPHHRDGLVLWLPFNEHPEDGLQVRDHSQFLTNPSVTGLVQSARVWDADRGWSLALPPTFSAQMTAQIPLGDVLTATAWIKLAAVPSGVQKVFCVGNLRCGITSVSGTAYFGVIDSDGQLATRLSAPVGEFFFAGVKQSGTQVTVIVGSSSTTTTRTLPLSDAILISGGACQVTINDLRVWQKAKSSAELALVTDYAPKTTACLYPLPLVESVNHQDKHAFVVLPSGFVVLGTPPSVQRNTSQVRVRRYDGSGRYVGDPRFDEVGLGGGPALPSPWLLGGREQFLLSAAGTTVVAGTHGSSGTSVAFGNVVSRSALPDTTGGVECSIGDTSWAAPAFNTAVERIWVEGNQVSVDVDVGWPTPEGVTRPQTAASVYAVTVDATESGGVVTGTLRAERILRADYNDQPTGSLTAVATGTNRLSVTGAGVVYRDVNRPSLTVPPAYLYAHSVLLESVPDAAVDSRWEESSTFGLAQTPPRAVLFDNGTLAFSNGSAGGTLDVGMYRLRLDVGNLGTVDGDFDGFNIEISIGDTLLSKRVLVNQTGSDFRQWEEIEFHLDKPVDNTYSLEIAVLNARHDEVRGTSRRLIVYGYELRRLKTTLFRVSVDDSGVHVTHLPVVDPASETGGWRVAISTSGTQSFWQHESRHYPEMSTLPSAVLLTSSTSLRREDHAACADADSTADEFTSPLVAPVLSVT